MTRHLRPEFTINFSIRVCDRAVRVIANSKLNENYKEIKVASSEILRIQEKPTLCRLGGKSEVTYCISNQTINIESKDETDNILIEQ